MTGPTRPPRPSAADGYQRLARTRAAVSGHAADGIGHPATAAAGAGTEPLPGRRRGARIAGGMRLAAFIVVLLLIVGTSVSLASTGGRGDDEPTEPAARTAPDAAVEDAPAEDPAPAPEADAGPGPAKAARAQDEPTPEPRAPAPAPAAAAAQAPPVAPAPSGALPFTGVPRVEHSLLAGALLVLAGMLAQIAGQPLPARARTR